MGVLNVTPDSFSDEGRFYQVDCALQEARRMIAAGADVIDIGGESSRPGALPVSCTEELERVIPLIERLCAECDICISIDTTKAEVMQAAIHAGACFINDITALKGQGSLATAAALDVPVCLVHMQGEPRTMQHDPHYQEGVVHEINQFFQEQIEVCVDAGIRRENLILDPGFGFGKTVSHNLQLVNEITAFQCHQCPILLGVSRKSTLGIILDKPVQERLWGGLAIAVFAAIHGVAIIRTHDVNETKQAFSVIEAVRNHS